MEKCVDCKYKQIKDGKQLCHISDDGKMCHKQCLYELCENKDVEIVVKYSRRDRCNFHNMDCRFKETGRKKSEKFQAEIASGKRGPNGETLYVKCLGPGKEHWFWTFDYPTGRKMYCSNYCATHSSSVIEKRKKTNLEKYGFESAGQSEDIKAKIRKTNLEKYGVEYGLSNKDVRQKIEATNVKKYGKKNCMQNKEIKQKAINTTIERYGVDNVSKSVLIKQKKEQTSLNNFGVKYHTQLDSQKQKVKEAMLDKYGIDNICQKDLKNIENYNKEYIEANFVEDGYFLFHECKSYFNIKQDTTVHRMKRRFDIVYPNKRMRSVVEKEIVAFLKSFYEKTITMNNFDVLSANVLGKRNPLELDVYLPDSKLAIEFDGLMYHSYGKSKYEVFNNYDVIDENKHLSKTLMCESLGIQLLHIFENEWEDKRRIWESMIKVKLGYADVKINARDCNIREIGFKEERDFLEENHIQGYTHASQSYGLYYKDELVQVMSFSKVRFVKNKKYDWELIRECSKLNTVVRGGYSKLLQHFCSINEGSIMSYANRRWSSPLVNNNGILIKTTLPNHFYFLPNEYILYSRAQFTLKDFQKKVGRYDNSLNKDENLVNNGYRIIYDCGNLLYRLNN